MAMPTMKIWGMISLEDEETGFDVVLDNDWYVLLMERDEIVARFDPRDYTSIELQTEVKRLLRARQSDNERC